MSIFAKLQNKVSRDELYCHYRQIKESEYEDLVKFCVAILEGFHNIGYDKFGYLTINCSIGGESKWLLCLWHKDEALFGKLINIKTTVKDFPYIRILDIATELLAHLHFADFSISILPLPIAEEILEHL